MCMMLRMPNTAFHVNRPSTPGNVGMFQTRHPCLMLERKPEDISHFETIPLVRNGWLGANEQGLAAENGFSRIQLWLEGRKGPFESDNIAPKIEKRTPQESKPTFDIFRPFRGSSFGNPSPATPSTKPLKPETQHREPLPCLASLLRELLVRPQQHLRPSEGERRDLVLQPPALG